MEIPDLNFQLNLDCPSYEELIRWFMGEWTDLGIEWGGPGITMDKRLEIDRHHKGERYPYYVLVDHKRNTAPDLNQSDLDRQVEFVRMLIARLEDKGCRVEFSGYFEEYL